MSEHIRFTVETITKYNVVEKESAYSTAKVIKDSIYSKESAELLAMQLNAAFENGVQSVPVLKTE